MVGVSVVLLLLITVEVVLVHTFLIGQRESWLYLQIHALPTASDDDNHSSSSCQSQIQQVQAIKVGTCQPKNSFFSMLYSQYIFSSNRMLDYEFSYEFVLINASDDDGNNNNNDNNNYNNESFTPSSLLFDIHQVRDVSFVHVKPFGQFIIYEGSRCEGPMIDEIPLSSLSSISDQLFIIQPSNSTSQSIPWAINSCLPRRMASGDTLGAISLRYLQGESKALLELNYTQQLVMEETYFEPIDGTVDCLPPSLLATTITSTEACISLDGFTSTYYVCASIDGHHTKTFYSNSSSCHSSTSNNDSYALSSELTCPIADDYYGIPSSHNDTLEEDLLYRSLCKAVIHQQGMSPTLSPVEIPTMAPTMRVTPILTFGVSFVVAPLSNDDPTLIASESLHDVFSESLCSQLQLPSKSACVCPLEGCLSIDISPSTHTLNANTEDYLSKVHQLRGNTNLISPLLSSQSTEIVLKAMLNVTVNIIDFIDLFPTPTINDSLSPSLNDLRTSDSLIRSDTFTTTTSVSDSQAIGITLSILTSRLLNYGDTGAWSYLASNLFMYYPSWFQNVTLELRDTQIKLLNIDNINMVSLVPPSLSPSIAPSKQLIQQYSATNLQIIGITIGLVIVLIFPICIMVGCGLCNSNEQQVRVLPLDDNMNDNNNAALDERVTSTALIR